MQLVLSQDSTTVLLIHGSSSEVAVIVSAVVASILCTISSHRWVVSNVFLGKAAVASRFVLINMTKLFETAGMLSIERVSVGCWQLMAQSKV